MIYARQPTEEERRARQPMRRQAIGRVSQRAHLILLSAQRHPGPAWALLLTMSRATVRVWLRRCNAHGPAGLDDDPRSGRPRQVNPHVQELLVTMRQDAPRPEGDLATCWTVALVGLALVHTVAVPLSASALRVAWHELGLRWGRPRLAMPATGAPAQPRNQGIRAKAVVEAGPEATMRYGDASRLPRLPRLRAMWPWAGEQRRVPTPGPPVTRALFGALHRRTGRWGYLVRERLRTGDFLAFLDLLLVPYPQGPILLIVDHVSSPTAHAVGAWVAAHPRLHRYSWPKYWSPVNPVERIWLRLKHTLAADRCDGAMQG
jgi:transposase